MPAGSDSFDFLDYDAPPQVALLPVRVFDNQAQAWVERVDTQATTTCHSFSAATFNTWFQGPDRPTRYRGLLAELRQADADIIFLQEATQSLVETLEQEDWVRAAYRIVRAPFHNAAIPVHGLMLLSRLPLAAGTLFPLPTNMGRRLLTAQVMLHGTPMTLATVHLESMKQHGDTRGEQLQKIFALLEPHENALLCGDFNFCSSNQMENDRLAPRFVDIWPALRPGEAGYTQDTAANPMLARSKGEEKRVRIDRVLLRSDTGACVPRTIRLLGTAPVAGSGRTHLLASDHFGLLASFALPQRG